MKFTETTLSGLFLIEPKVFGDNRGFFMETWQKKKFEKAGLNFDFVQDNHSSSTKGTLRGLHFQIQQPQGKLVRVISGEVFDVAVDIRPGSTTFGKWYGEILSADNKKMFWVPPGFAHGFYVTSDYAEFLYKCTDYYAPEFERCIIWNDEKLGIKWPIPSDTQPLLSKKDLEGKTFTETIPFLKR
ncbi:MAG: dTDP-4-dehydrorhamnose 3,5-epimerase [Candidatus Riflebacteria bacterium]|nr:dTDP-4-dehydrorhamnose 3,5-epimerase [Candidatus Riflebacteria bacterium]